MNLIKSKTIMASRVTIEKNIIEEKKDKLATQFLLSLDPMYFESTTIAEKYSCPICLLIPNPQCSIEHISCGKIFCEGCLNSWLKDQHKDFCPACNMKDLSMNIRNIKSENEPIYTMLNSLVIRCPSPPDEGFGECKWKEEWNKLDNHLEKCEFKLVNCQHGCGSILCRERMIEHEAKLCPKKPKECKYCCQYFYQIETHEEICEKNPDKKFSCKFEVGGCPFKGSKAELEEHYHNSKEVHLGLFESFIDKFIHFKEKEEKHQLLIKNFTYFSHCINSHPLEFTTNHSHFSDYTCNVCGQAGIPMSIGTYRCDSCDWDCCPTCHTIPCIEHPLKYSFCPNNKEHIMVKSTHKKALNQFCQICNRYARNMSTEIAYWCPYCKVVVCYDCWEK